MRPQTSKRLRGFTLVELLVVIAIIGVLISLLLPAVQTIRQSASRTSCANNLKQLCIALHQYHDWNGYFPPSDTTGPPKKHSWVPFILPYIEQPTLFSDYNFNLHWFDPAQTAKGTQLRVLQCPATPMPDREDTIFTPPAACGDYNAVTRISPDLIVAGLVSPTPDIRGVLVRNENTRIADITDGTSYTILLGEDAGRPQLWNAGRLVPGGYALGAGWADNKGPFFINGSTSDGSVPLGPCAINCTNDNEFYGFHPGGAQAAFADGSTHFLPASIDIRILAALVTRAGVEAVSTNDY